ncbi:MAG: hypothetical protein HQL33_10835 [Alphaproteobacteria bacterium]|nr:hypothetical protein [Alphaproteobacteria bacterium]
MKMFAIRLLKSVLLFFVLGILIQAVVGLGGASGLRELVELTPLLSLAALVTALVYLIHPYTFGRRRRG